MSKLSFYAGAALVATSAFQLFAATPEAFMNAAPIPGADVHYYSNYAKLRTSPIYKKIEDITKKMRDPALDEDGSKIIRAFFEICEREGLSEDNVEVYILSAAVEKIATHIIKALKEDEEPKIIVDDFNILFALAVKKPVTRDNSKRLVDGVIKLAPDDDFAEEFNKRVAMDDFEHAGVPGLKITFKLDEDELKEKPFDKLPVVAMAFPAGGRVVYYGLEKDVKAAIDRANAGAKAEPSPALKKLLDSPLAGTPLGQRDCYGAWAVPLVFRDAMKDLHEEHEESGSGMLPGMLPGLKAATVLQGVRGFAAYGEKLDGVINFVLDSAESATALKEMLEINVLGLGKMGLYQFVGKNTEFAEKLAAVVEGESTSIQFSVGAADIDLYFEQMEKMMDGPAFAPFFIDEDDE